MKNDWPTYYMGEISNFIELSVSQERKDNSKVYRFMSINRFKEFFDTQLLFFAQAKILSDKFEGGYVIPGLEEVCRENRDSTFVSCWTKNDPLIESSLLMWRPHYNEVNKIEFENHIAIGVTINKFFLNEDSSFIFGDKKFEKYIGNMNYLYQDDKYPNYQANSLAPFFLKRIDYIDENEIRIVIQDMKRRNPSRSFQKYQILNGILVPGILVPIDFKKIDEIFISPISESDIDNINGFITRERRGSRIPQPLGWG